MYHIYTSLSIRELQEDFWLTFRSLLETLETDELIYIGLSWGRSCDIYYAMLLTELYRLPEAIRRRLRFALLDERIVPMGSPESNIAELREKFLTSLITKGVITEDQLLEVDQIAVDDIAFRYSQKVPRIDIALFGVGEDWHIASLFPTHALLTSTGVGYLDITDAPKDPPHRITVSPKMIEKMKYIFLSFPPEKAAVYERFSRKDISSFSLPVKLIWEEKQVFISRHLTQPHVS
jgi:6-phosphogluconolactonase/glucosamine-6-phosphate isomerase/deaminase